MKTDLFQSSGQAEFFKFAEILILQWDNLLRENMQTHIQ